MFVAISGRDIERDLSLSTRMHGIDDCRLDTQIRRPAPSRAFAPFRVLDQIWLSSLAVLARRFTMTYPR